MSEHKTLAEVIDGAMGDIAGVWDLDSDETNAIAKVVLAHLASEQVVEAVAQMLVEHEYSETWIGRCHCGVKTDNMPRHQAEAALAAQREVLGGEGA